MSNENTITPRQAIDCLATAFGAYPDYAHGWHCNIAMSFVDAFPKDAGIDYSIIHAAANDAAERFMFSCFGARNTSNPQGKEQ